MARIFKLTIRCDNAAFDGEALGLELGRILRDAARLVEFGATPAAGTLRDINGNRVGAFDIKSALKR